MAQGTSAGRRRDHEPLPEWDTRQMHQRSSDDNSTNIAQMEKSLKWWYECSGNWKERWLLAKKDRNELQKELKYLHLKFNTVSNEIVQLKAERRELEVLMEKYKTDNERMQGLILKHIRSNGEYSIPIEDLFITKMQNTADNEEDNQEEKSNTNEQERQLPKYKSLHEQSKAVKNFCTKSTFDVMKPPDSLIQRYKNQQNDDENEANTIIFRELLSENEQLKNKLEMLLGVNSDLEDSISKNESEIKKLKEQYGTAETEGKTIKQGDFNLNLERRVTALQTENARLKGVLRSQRIAFKNFASTFDNIDLVFEGTSLEESQL